RLDPLYERGKDPAAFFKVSVSFDYQVKNVSAGSDTFTILAWLDDIVKSSDPDAARLPEFTRVAFGKQPPKVGVNIQELLVNGTIRTKERALELSLPADSIGPNDVMHVEVAGTSLMRTTDHFVWHLTTLTQKLNVDITLGGALTFNQLEFYPQALHHISH